MDDLEVFLRGIPKAELHVHFTGTLQRALFERLDQKYLAQEQIAIARAFDRSDWLCQRNFA